MEPIVKTTLAIMARHINTIAIPPTNSLRLVPCADVGIRANARIENANRWIVVLKVAL